MPHHPAFAAFARPRRGGGMYVLAAGMFVLGLAAGTLARPALAPRAAAAVASPTQLADSPEPAPPAEISSGISQARLVYPAEVVRVIDGDTFEARVQVWPGVAINTKVRLRDIDAPELHARCDDERVRAEAARAALTALLADGGVAISRVGLDKYGGRVDAAVSTRSTGDVSAALFNGGFARRYDGGRRGSWC
jgi:endonuclease YncB( thermonuclease family)